MKRLAVLNVVGLSESLLGPATPRLTAFRNAGSFTSIRPSLPAVTCTAQSNYLTGRLPCDHGIVANGWFNRELAEVHFWKQSNHLVQGPKVWDRLRADLPGFTCAQLFWWFNMYSSADFTITPRPMYPADGRKLFDVYSWPYDLRREIKRELGEFPFFGFWGPAAGIQTPQGSPDATTRWIAEAAKWVEQRHAPTLNLVYLPHLDYNLQRLGPGHPEILRDLARIDAIFGDLLDFFQRQGVEVMVLSEYGISAVNQPVHLNRVFRARGWLVVKEELGLELLDAGASRVFAVADHQVAHIYVNDRTLLGEARATLERTPGVGEIWGPEDKRVRGLDHPRAGDLVAVAASGAWFTYYYWLDDHRAPDFARTVDIHRKPGYDPVELFVDPALALPKARVAWRLLQKRLGFRMLMDIVPLNATLVKGSHGALPADRTEHPIAIAGRAGFFPSSDLDSTAIHDTLRRLVHS